MKKRKKVNIWLHSAAGIISIVMAISSIIILLFAWGLEYTMSDSRVIISSILIGVATNFIGIIITVCFVQYFLDKQRNDMEKQEEIAKILRYSIYANILLDSYIYHYNALVIPAIENIHEDCIYTDFEFKDLSEMYQNTIFLNDGLNRSRIETFYEIEGLLRNYFMKMVENIDFVYEKGVINILLEFLAVSQHYNVKESLLANQNIKTNSATLAKFITEMMVNDERDFVSEYDNGTLGSNLIVPYVLLFKMLKTEGDLIIQFQNELSRIEEKVATG